MKKIIMRTEGVRGSLSRIQYILDEGQRLEDLEIKEGKNFILREGFDENENTYLDLYEKYNDFIEKGYSDYFSWMYIIKEGFGIMIDSHIYVCKYDSDVDRQLRKIFEWGYVEAKHFIGDVWWFEDEEILDDIQHMSIVDFLDKYRGI